MTSFKTGAETTAPITLRKLPAGMLAQVSRVSFGLPRAAPLQPESILPRAAISINGNERTEAPPPVPREILNGEHASTNEREAPHTAHANPSPPCPLLCADDDGMGLATAHVPAAPLALTQIPAPLTRTIILNAKQQAAVGFFLGAKQMVLIGSAGTGKSTLMVEALAQAEFIEPVFHGVHKFLPTGASAIFIVSFTNRAVKNSRKILTAKWNVNIHTIHRALEYAPIYYEEWDAEESTYVNKMRFEAVRNEHNPCPEVSLVIIEEAGQCSLQLHDELKAAFPNARFIYVGDIYQLPPVYGSSILGYKLADSVTYAAQPQHPAYIPCVELTEVYRQALDSPILARAIEVKNGKCDAFLESNIKKQKRHEWNSPAGSTSQSRLVVHVIDPKTDPYGSLPRDKESREIAIAHLNTRFGRMFKATLLAGGFDKEEDVILIPHRKAHTFGAFQMNRWVADAIREQENLEIHEVIAGFNKYYFALGDRVTTGKVEGKIVDIRRNKKYFGKWPRIASKLLNRWGMHLDHAHDKFEDDLDAENEAMRQLSPEDIDALLARDKIEERTNQASHIITVHTEDNMSFEFITSSEVNGIEFAYALTTHQAQGSEWNRVFIMLHSAHSGMYSREWLYTALTRAKKEAQIICRAPALQKCVETQRVRGETLAEKAQYFKGKQGEAQRILELRAKFGNNIDLGDEEG